MVSTQSSTVDRGREGERKKRDTMNMNLAESHCPVDSDYALKIILTNDMNGGLHFRLTANRYLNVSNCIKTLFEAVEIASPLFSFSLSLSLFLYQS